jgi:hypothetical protein
MLWYKAWLETRLRFFIGLGLLLFMACGVTFEYRAVQQLMPLAESMRTDSGFVGRAIQQAIAVESTYRGFVWYQWFRQNLSQTWMLFALIIGTGGLSPHRGALYTLSMPVSRARLVAVRAGTGLAELFTMAIVPSLLLPILAVLGGQSYPLGDAIVHALCVFVGGSAVFGLTVLFSTEFSDAWTPAILSGVVITVLGIMEFVPALEPYGLFHTMAAESYFSGNGLPWGGLIVSAVAAALLLWAAAGNLRRRDL